MQVCNAVPETQNHAEWRRGMLEQYTECAVLHNQCRRALIEFQGD